MILFAFLLDNGLYLLIKKEDLESYHICWILAWKLSLSYLLDHKLKWIKTLPSAQNMATWMYL